MRSFRNAFVILVASAICLVVGSEQNWPGPSSVFKDRLGVAHETLLPSREIAVSIFVDATSSMRGYVAKGSLELPQQVRRLEETTRLVWNNVTSIRCYGFGTQAFAAPAGVACYSAVLRPDFFRLRKEQDYTKIESILSNLPEKGLTIVVTDLFEDSANLGVLFEAFKKSVFSHRLAVGIIASRAEFSGTIYDIGLAKGTRNWRGERPLYAIVIGQLGDVESYFVELSHGAVAENQLLILSGTLLGKPISWGSGSRTRTSGVSVDSEFIRVARGDLMSFGVVRLRNNNKCELDLKFDARRAPFRPGLNWSRLENKLRVKRFPKSSGAAEDVNFESDAITSRAAVGTASGTIVLNLAWLPKRIRPAGRDYIEEISLPVRSDMADFSVVPFVQGWSSTPDTGTAAAFDGSKTQYLSDFVLGLWKSLVQAENPDLGSVYVYFQPER